MSCKSYADILFEGKGWWQHLKSSQQSVLDICCAAWTPPLQTKWSVKRIAYTGRKVKEKKMKKGVEKKRRNKDVEIENSMV